MKNEIRGAIDGIRSVLKTAKEILKGGPGSGNFGHGGRPGEIGGSGGGGGGGGSSVSALLGENVKSVSDGAAKAAKAKFDPVGVKALADYTLGVEDALEESKGKMGSEIDRKRIGQWAEDHIQQMQRKTAEFKVASEGDKIVSGWITKAQDQLEVALRRTRQDDLSATKVHLHSAWRKLQDVAEELETPADIERPKS